MREGSAANGRAWLGEPLPWFAALGVALFAVYALARPATPEDAGREDDARIEIPAALADAGPAVVDRYIDDELVYREGLALALDRGDPVVRDRVIERFVEQALADVEPPEPTQAQLAEFMQAHRERYRTGLRLDFEQIFISKRRHDDADVVAASVLTALRDGADPRRTVGRYSAGKRFTLGRVAGTFGRDFAEGLVELEPGTWRNVEVDSGHHLVRITHRDAGGKIPPLREIRGRVRRDFLAADRRAHRQALVDRLRAKFTVERPS